MSGIDDLCGCLAVCCTCCCVGCNEASGLWCFYRSCSCRRRQNMDDNDFERTVEELYAPNKTSDTPGGLGPASSHVLELQPRGKDAQVKTTQPGARPSMEARPRRSGDAAPPAEEGEREPGASRTDRRERTREWVHAHSASEPGLDVPRTRSRSRSREHSRPRSKSHADGVAVARGNSERERVPWAPGGSERAPPTLAKEKGSASDAQAYASAWRRSEDHGEGERSREEWRGPASPESPRSREEDRQEEDRGHEGTALAPRPDIPASLRPGQSRSPPQLPPLAFSDEGGKP